MSEEELEALAREIAVKVLGWRPESVHAVNWYDSGHFYSSNMSDAWDVVEHMRQQGWRFSLGEYTYGGKWQAMFEMGTPFDGDGSHQSGADVNESAPVAICRAALAALAGQVTGGPRRMVKL